MNATNPFNISNYTRTAMVLPTNISVLLRANHGLGKSQVQRQICEAMRQENPDELGDFEFIDRRLSQMSEGDMIGLPSTDGNMTRFNPPDWYYKACQKPCFLFLDELNRATPEVMQAAFQIVLDRELNGMKLHPLTRVSAAVNMGASYSVNEIDPALTDRFFIVDLVPTVKDWITWAKAKCIVPSSPKFGKQNVHENVVEFIKANNKWLDMPKNADPSDCNPSRRSWERVSDALILAGVIDNPKDHMFYLLTMGFVGTEAAIALQDFVKNFDNQISGEEILMKFHTKRVKEKIERQGQEGLNLAIDKLSEHVLKTFKTKFTKRQGENLRDFMKTLPGELRINCWTKLTVDGVERTDLVRAVHKWCAKDLLDVFGVPMGEAGKDVVPKIPGMFADKNDNNTGS